MMLRPDFAQPAAFATLDDQLRAIQAHGIGTWLRARLGEGASLVADSRRVRPGDAFFAYPGSRVDGRDHIGDALARGARAVVREAGGNRLPAPQDGTRSRGSGPGPNAEPQAELDLEVEGLRDLAGLIAHHFHREPSSRMRVVAVTGTNGKTTVAHWIARGLAQPQRPAGLIGTLGCALVAGRGEPAYRDGGLTTPDALDLQATLAGFLTEGARAVAMEASSIGLDQGRMTGTEVEVGVFTNLSRDHLDYHGSMEAYADAKAMLFALPRLRAAVINGDDPVCMRMLAAIDAQPRRRPVLKILYGQSPGQHGARGHRVLMIDRMVENAHGIVLSLTGDFGDAEFVLPLLGRFNVANAMATAGAWLAMGMSLDEAVAHLSELEPVTGRMQRLGQPGEPMVIIDYAHTPDALAGALQALRPAALARGGALWCVFGAGGDRDPGKRPMMGYLAQRGADRLVITSDNPRSEEPFRIVSDIRAGLSREPFATELDRARAIRLAIARAGRDDVILIAGKGHEQYQEIRGQRIPFSDADIARQALAQRGAQEPSSPQPVLASQVPDV